MRGVLFIFISLELLASPLKAQKSVASLMLQHSIASPTGNTRKFINNVSLRGIMVDYRFHLSPEFCIGGSAGLQTFFEVEENHLEYDSKKTAVLHGTQHRYMNSVPLFFVADYYMKAEEIISKFVGLAAGITCNRFDSSIGGEKERLQANQFTLAPEAGMRFGYDFGISAYISFRYTYSFKNREVDNQSYASMNLGLMIR